MKLKEKLALDDYNNNRFRMDITTDVSCIIESAFIAGFEKAKEMAIEVHSACGAASGCCSDVLMCLGDEDVRS